MKKTAEECGRIAARMSPDQVPYFMESSKKKFEIYVNEIKDKSTHKIELLQERINKLLIEISQQGDVSQLMTRGSLYRAMFQCSILISCLGGEFCLVRWMVEPFGLYLLETLLISLGLVLITIEGMDLYITSLRRKYPHSEQNLFLILGSIGFLLILLIAFFGTELRNNLYQATTALNSSLSPEETVRAADHYFKNTTGPFIYFLFTLTVLIVIVGGYAFHDTKLRLIAVMSYFKMHRDLEKARTEQTRIHEQVIELGAQLNSFESEFNHSLLMSQNKRKEEESGDSLGNQIQQNVRQNLGFIIASPIFLIMLVLALFLIFRGTAKGETIAILDMTLSSNVSDYSGGEEWRKNVTAVEAFIQQNLIPGERYRIVAITDRSFSNPFILLDSETSKEKGAFGEKIAKDRIRFLQQLRKLNLRPTAKSSDVFGSIQLAAILFSPGDKRKKLVIFSDMREFSKRFDFETPHVIPVEAVLRDVMTKSLIPSLDGVKVWCLGVHSAGKAPAYWSSLRSFWTQYFKQAKAIEPIVFSMERRVIGYE